MQQTFGRFLKALEALDSQGVALIYFKGHGARDAAGNYIFGVNARRDEDVRRIEWGTEVLAKAFTHRRKATILFLDACREPPRNYEPGLAEPTTIPTNTVISFAAQPNRTAVIPSPYTKALIKRLGYPGERLDDTLQRVKTLVSDQTKGQQAPEPYGSAQDFMFRPPVVVTLRSVAPDDVVEVKINGRTALSSTIAEDGKTATAPLVVGRNPLEILVYNKKSKKGGLAGLAGELEGWRYDIYFSTPDGSFRDRLNDGEHPGTEARSDKLFLAGTATLVVDETTFALTMIEKKPRVWAPEKKQSERGRSSTPRSHGGGRGGPGSRGD
jgi:hypothetical protein